MVGVFGAFRGIRRRFSPDVAEKHRINLYNQLIRIKPYSDTLKKYTITNTMSFENLRKIANAYATAMRNGLSSGSGNNAVINKIKELGERSIAREKKKKNKLSVNRP